MTKCVLLRRRRPHNGWERTGEEVELSLEFATGSVYGFDLVGFIAIRQPSPAALLIIGGLLMMFCQRRRV